MPITSSSGANRSSSSSSPSRPTSTSTSSRPGGARVAPGRPSRARRLSPAERARHGADLGLSLLATAIGTYFRHLGFADSSIISLYILTALLTAVTTEGRACTLLSSVLSVVLYNFCFVTPLFSLDSYDRSYLVTFAIMFVTAMVAAELTARLTNNARASAKNAFRTRVLLETNQLLQQAEGMEARARVAMSQLIKLLRLDIVFYPASGDLLGDALYEPAGTQDRSASILTEYERAVATWTFTNNKHAGASTRTLPEAQCLYLAVRAGERRCSASSASRWRDASSRHSRTRSCCPSWASARLR